MAASVVVVDGLVSLVVVAVGAPDVGVAAETALEQPAKQEDAFGLEIAPGEAAAFFQALLHTPKQLFVDERGYSHLDPFASRSHDTGTSRRPLARDVEIGGWMAPELGAVVVGCADVPFTPQHPHHCAHGPFPAPSPPLRFLELPGHTVNRGILFVVPRKDLTHHRRFFLMNLDLAVPSMPLGVPSVAVRQFAGSELAHSGSVESSAAGTFQDLGPFVLGNRALDLEEKLVVWGIADGPFTEVNLHPRTVQLFEE